MIHNKNDNISLQSLKANLYSFKVQYLTYFNFYFKKNSSYVYATLHFIKRDIVSLQSRVYIYKTHSSLYWNSNIIIKLNLKSSSKTFFP